MWRLLCPYAWESGSSLKSENLPLPQPACPDSFKSVPKHCQASCHPLWESKEWKPRIPALQKMTVQCNKHPNDGQCGLSRQSLRSCFLSSGGEGEGCACQRFSTLGAAHGGHLWTLKHSSCSLPHTYSDVELTGLRWNPDISRLFFFLRTFQIFPACNQDWLLLFGEMLKHKNIHDAC